MLTTEDFSLNKLKQKAPHKKLLNTNYHSEYSPMQAASMWKNLKADQVRSITNDAYLN